MSVDLVSEEVTEIACLSRCLWSEGCTQPGQTFCECETALTWKQDWASKDEAEGPEPKGETGSKSTAPKERPKTQYRQGCENQSSEERCVWLGRSTEYQSTHEREPDQCGEKTAEKDGRSETVEEVLRKGCGLR